MKLPYQITIKSLPSIKFPYIKLAAYRTTSISNYENKKLPSYQITIPLPSYQITTASNYNTKLPSYQITISNYNIKLPAHQITSVSHYHRIKLPTHQITMISNYSNIKLPSYENNHYIK
jgi:hypothetical protein